MEEKIIRLVYTLFVGILLAVFVGVGINTFYPSPKAPTYPTELTTYSVDGMSVKETAKQTAAQRTYEEKNKTYQESLKKYNRNVSLIALGAALVLLALSQILAQKTQFMADGVLLGGLLTLFYSLGRAFAADNSKYSFAVSTIGLAAVMYVGYRRFVREHAVVKPTKK